MINELLLPAREQVLSNLKFAADLCGALLAGQDLKNGARLFAGLNSRCFGISGLLIWTGHFTPVKCPGLGDHYSWRRIETRPTGIEVEPLSILSFGQVITRLSVALNAAGSRYVFGR